LSVRWYCFHHAGGSRAWFNQLRLEVPAGVELVFVEYPGHGTRLFEPRLSSVTQLAQSLAQELPPAPGEGYGVLGHSFGSLVAYEFSRALRTRGHGEPRGMLLSGCRPPWAPDDTPPLHRQGDDALIDRLRSLGGTPEEILADPDALEIILPIFRADLQASETYHLDCPDAFGCNVLALRGSQDSVVSLETLNQWRHATRGHFATYQLTGGHFCLLDDPAFPKLLRRFLDAAYCGRGQHLTQRSGS
jgi:surfactin synthase thioesterase subunit